METVTVRKEAMNGGKGHVIIKHLLGEKELNGKCGLYAEVTLEPGCEIGWHVHLGESEAYYILSGEGQYNDNGAPRPVHKDCVTFTSSGMGHRLLNTGTENLVLMALIIKG